MLYTITEIYILQITYHSERDPEKRKADAEASTSSAKCARPYTDFTTASVSTKRRRTAELRSTTSTEELLFATGMSLRSSGANDAANVVDNLTSSPSRASKYRTGVKLAEKPRQAEISSDIALSDVVEGKMTYHSYQVVRLRAKSCGLPLYPSYRHVLEAKKRTYPPNITISETSADVKLQSLLDHTSERILIVQKDVIEALHANTASNMRFIFKWGCDGSSGQSEYKQLFAEENQSDANVFLTSIVPLQLLSVNDDKSEEVIIWKNPRPSSPRYCRPIRLQFLHENVESTLSEMHFVEEQINTLVSFQTVIFRKEIKITYEMAFTMIDGKVCNAVTSTKSTMRCYLCGSTSKEFNNLKLVLTKPVNDANLRFGLSTLHAWIRFFECFLHLGYKLDIKKWQARSVEEKESVSSAKKAIQAGFQKQLGLLVDRPKPGYGNTNDGNSARRFFANSKVSAQILGVDENVINRFHIILQVLASGYDVNIDEFKKYCLDTAELFVEKYPWYPMPTTVHKILIHSAQVIESCLLPIGQLSEEAQEARNKDVKKYRESFSRKCSRTKTMEDVFHWLLVSSDPLITSLRILPQKKFTSSLSSEAIRLLKSKPIPTSQNHDDGDESDISDCSNTSHDVSKYDD